MRRLRRKDIQTDEQTLIQGDTYENKEKKKWPWVLLIIFVLLVIIIITFISNIPKMEDLIVYKDYTVSRGSITSTITGSGVLESVDTEKIFVPDDIAISDVLVKVGDRVVAGETLATLDVESLKDRVAYLSGELSLLDDELSRISSSKTTEYVYASIKGRIKYIPVSTDSDVITSIAEYGSLAIISTDELMQVEIATTQDLTISSDVTVKWQDGSDTGKVTEKTENGYLITLDDDKAPYRETAQVLNGDILLGEGVLEIHSPMSIYANGGTISKIHFNINDRVKATSKLFTLNNEPLSSSYQQKYSERVDMAEQLETVLKYQNDPRILAINDGIISVVNVSEGTKTGTDNSFQENSAFVVNIGGAIKMKVSVDERDILSVSLDQDATVTLDAVTSDKFTAKVTHISNLGNVEGNITTYVVYLSLPPDTRFFEGMNGNATILVNQADNVLIIPIEAINEDSSGAFVYIGSNSEKTYITTGLSDGEYTEVTNGLLEGDVIQYLSSDPFERYF